MSIEENLFEKYFILDNIFDTVIESETEEYKLAEEKVNLIEKEIENYKILKEELYKKIIEKKKFYNYFLQVYNNCKKKINNLNKQKEYYLKLYQKTNKILNNLCKNNEIFDNLSKNNKKFLINFRFNEQEIIYHNVYLEHYNNIVDNIKMNIEQLEDDIENYNIKENLAKEHIKDIWTFYHMFKN
jgi:hypothetical protein